MGTIHIQAQRNTMPQNQEFIMAMKMENDVALLAMKGNIYVALLATKTTRVDA